MIISCPPYAWRLHGGYTGSVVPQMEALYHSATAPTDEFSMMMPGTYHALEYSADGGCTAGSNHPPSRNLLP